MNKIQELEAEIEEEWMNRDASTPISIRYLVELLKIGLEECHKEEMCYWRDYATNGYCRCTRDALPSTQAVELYKRLRTLTLQVNLAKHLSKLAQLPSEQGDDIQDGTH
mgnify:FL=1